MNSKLHFALLYSFLFSLSMTAQVFTTPPTVPVRTMAEWEELQSLVITWNINSATQWNILTEITRAARQECNVIIICANQSAVTEAQNYLTSKSVDITSNVSFLIAANNSIWVRDYGPNCVYANDVDSLMIVDWIYNRNRPADNTIPVKVGEFLHLPVFATSQAPYDLVNTGGNFMSDGMGTAFASNLIFINNDQIQNGECGSPNDVFGTSSHNEASIDNIMQEFMGIDRYIKLDPLPYDCIHHIDMHIKLIDEQTLLVGEYPANTADGPQIEANIQYILSHFETSFGTPFRIVRIPMPPENGAYPDAGGDYRTYANAVFVNKTIIVPFYQETFDTTARRIWQTAMPGYKIVGVNCNSIITSLGAIHCITKEIGVNDPLRIVHQPVGDILQNAINPANYPLTALIQHRSGIASAQVFYRQKQATSWESVPLMQTSGLDSTAYWTGAIPRQEGYFDTLYYYISAEANNGKTQVRPLTSPEGAWTFRIVADISATTTPTTHLLDIYPNPASAMTVIPVESTVKKEGKILLTNTLGQIVAEIFSGDLPIGKSNYFLDASRYAPGIYFVELRSNGTTKTRKLIIR